jgi:hypothetical protein
MRFFKILSAIIVLTGVVTSMNACDKGGQSFSLLSETNTFKQSGTYTPRKIDILWVVDNSSSMLDLQSSLATQFQSFISRFQTLGYDFKMAVQTTDVYKSGSKNFVSLGGHPAVMSRDTENLTAAFTSNVSVGADGSSDERAFQSMIQSLNDPANASFRRPDAFLAVIIVSNEDDLSRNLSQSEELHICVKTFPATFGVINSNCNSSITFPLDGSADCDCPQYNPVNYANKFTSIDSVKSDLNLIAGVNNHSVYYIGIPPNTQSCLNERRQTDPTARFGTRYDALAAASGGSAYSICEPFAESLQLISDKVLLSTANFKLDREPVIESISVLVNGVALANDPINGWTYDPATMIVQFHGSGIPAVGDNVQINYDPVKAKN